VEEEEGYGIAILTLSVLRFFASLIPRLISSCSIQSPVPTVSTDQLQNRFKVYCTVDILQKCCILVLLDLRVLAKNILLSLSPHSHRLHYDLHGNSLTKMVYAMGL